MALGTSSAISRTGVPRGKQHERREASQAEAWRGSAEANAVFDQQQAKLDAFFDDSPLLMTIGELRAAGLAVPASSTRDAGRVRCVSCGGAINDPPSIPLGYHMRCAPTLSEILGHPLVR